MSFFCLRSLGWSKFTHMTRTLHPSTKLSAAAWLSESIALFTVGKMHLSYSLLCSLYCQSFGFKDVAVIWSPSRSTFSQRLWKYISSYSLVKFGAVRKELYRIAYEVYSASPQNFSLRSEASESHCEVLWCYHIVNTLNSNIIIQNFYMINLIHMLVSCSTVSPTWISKKPKI